MGLFSWLFGKKEEPAFKRAIPSKPDASISKDIDVIGIRIVKIRHEVQPRVQQKVDEILELVSELSDKYKEYMKTIAELTVFTYPIIGQEREYTPEEEKKKDRMEKELIVEKNVIIQKMTEISVKIKNITLQGDGEKIKNLLLPIFKKLGKEFKFPESKAENLLRL